MGSGDHLLGSRPTLLYIFSHYGISFLPSVLPGFTDQIESMMPLLLPLFYWFQTAYYYYRYLGTCPSFTMEHVCVTAQLLQGFSRCTCCAARSYKYDFRPSSLQAISVNWYHEARIPPPNLSCALQHGRCDHAIKRTTISSQWNIWHHPHTRRGPICAKYCSSRWDPGLDLGYRS